MNIFIIQKCPSWLLYTATVVWLLLMLVHMPTVGYSHKTGGTNNVTCLETERRALLEFKSGLEKPNESILSNWSAENMDCCRWEGIKCSKNGRVIALDLRYKFIRGEIGPSLLDLPYLEFLDLSHNDFSGKIPAFIGSLKRLRYLDLSYNYLEVDSLAWVSGLSSLGYLDMSVVNLSSTTDWLQSITNLSSLTYVSLHDCMLPSVSTLKHSNSTKPLQLQTLDLSYNELSSVTFLSNLTSIKHLDLSDNKLASVTFLSNLTSIKHLDLHHNELSSVTFLSNLTSIKHLDLSYNDLEGEIPEFFTSLLTLNASWNRLSNTSGFLQLGSTSLQELRLDNNKLTGLFPDLSKFPSLSVVKVAHNEFKGPLEPFLEKGFNLVELDVSSNSLDGVLWEDHFLNLTKLQVLILSDNSIALNFSTWWIPPFQLDVAMLSNCKLGPGFPHWLRGQSELAHLDISNSGISEAIPTWFWNISTRLQYVNISHNRINTKLPNYLPPCYVHIDLSSNNLYGAIPSFSSDLQLLDLSNNKFSGGMSFLCSLKVGNLRYLDLHNNLLSGNLHTCWERVINLELLNLNNNNFSGYLPHSMGNLTGLSSLSLRNNSLSGELPSSLINCEYLVLLDLGENQLSGMIPMWIGTSLKDLAVLALHGNRFRGNMPRALCHLQSIQILDLSFNNFSGIIPSCFNNFTVMANFNNFSLLSTWVGISDQYVDLSSDTYSEKYYTTWIAWKGLNLEFINQERLELLKLIDLSNNRLSGPIPRELASLYELVSLNLSRNSLTGFIPDNIGQLKMLESLDLSKNQLSGEIPRSMSNMSFLSYLDLSSNNLSGKIPSSTQFQGFDASVFNNNSMLCGPPTTNLCHGNRSLQPIPIDGMNGDHKSEAGIFHEDVWLYISIGVGFIVGFWGVCGTLVLKYSWRQRYFEVLNNWKEGISVAILVGISKLKRRLTS